jgi:hypothetical protein
MVRLVLCWFAGVGLALTGCSTSGSRAAADAGSSADSAVDAGQGADAGPEAQTGTPSLIALDVAGSPDGGALVLVPAFSPTTYDYYVPCAAGANRLTISMTASSGADSVVLQPTQSPAAPMQAFSLDVNEGDAIVAGARQGGATTEYWVRCLPHDFPKFQLTKHIDAGSPAPGYYLVGNMTGGLAGYAMVLDGNGVPVWFDRDGNEVANVDTVTPGVISFIDQHTGRSYENHQLSPLETTYVTIAGVPADIHELRALPNGDFLVLNSPIVANVDLTGLTLPLLDGGVQSFGPGSHVRECVVDEVDPKGKVIWEWTAGDHFDPVKDMTYMSTPEVYGTEIVVEPYHCNAIDVDTNGNLLVSSRHMDSVFYIEKATGKVLWKMGGATYSKDNATYVPVADPFYREHDARFQADWQSTCSGRSGSGKISVFDDESAMPNPARGVVYQVNVGAPGCGDAGAPGATLVWQFKGTSPVTATGSFRVLPGGGGIVGWGTIAGFIFTEVDASGHALLDLTSTDGSTSYRAIKVPLSAFDLNTLRATAGHDGPAPADAGAKEGGAQDAGSIDATLPVEASSDAGMGCHAISGSGASEQCSFSSPSPSPCGSDGGSTTGSCPSTGLYGCCVETVSTDGGQGVVATCYYSAATGQPASSQCAFEAYQGLPYTWQTQAP